MNKKNTILFGLFFVVILVLVFIILRISFFAPTDFISKTIHIEEGKNVNQILKILEEESIIKNKEIAKIILYLSQDKIIPAGYYNFPKKESVLKVMNRLQQGDYGQAQKRITIPEGLSVRQIATILSKNFDNFSQEKFILLAEEKEGFLFPDTYFFFPQVSLEYIVEIMENNFKNKTDELRKEAERQDKDWREIIIVASLVELEASEKEVRQMISDIIWRRLKIGMPLQIDAVFPYIMGKNTFELTLKDLQYDSPYNTYRYRGLPPGPIANPGLDSIEAALYPKVNNYLYYLSDKEGNMHYTVTHDEHVKNKQIYLR